MDARNEQLATKTKVQDHGHVHKDAQMQERAPTSLGLGRRRHMLSQTRLERVLDALLGSRLHTHAQGTKLEGYGSEQGAVSRPWPV